VVLVTLVIWAAAGNPATRRKSSADVRIPAAGRMCIPAKLNKPGFCAIKIGVAAAILALSWLLKSLAGEGFP
jgi:hypothetical protein